LLNEVMESPSNKQICPWIVPWIQIRNYYLDKGSLFQIQKYILFKSRKMLEMVGKPVYLTITRPDISLAIGEVSQFIQSPHIDHQNVDKGFSTKTKETLKLLDIVRQIGQAHLLTDVLQGIVFLLDGTLSLGRVKQNFVPQSSANAEYSVMSTTTCELIWFKHLLKE
ncbi:hypothetical protein CR513_01265, partial [Mucuna pruriens]